MTAELVKNMPAAEYHARFEISNSFLTAWKNNALKAVYERSNPAPQTPAMEFGEQVHLAVLEPKEYLRRYQVTPRLDRRTTAGKETWAKLCETYGEANLLPSDRYTQIELIAASVEAHPKAKNLLIQAKDRETVIFWKDTETGLDCKCRIDAMAGIILADLKTTDDASIEGFQASIFKYGYHRQGAMYLRACRAAGIDIQHYSIVAVEKEAPYGCNVFSLSVEALDQGERELQDLMKSVKLWQSTGIVPGYSDSVISASLPDWAWRRIEFEGVQEAA